VIERSLAQDGVEARAGKRQRGRPSPDPGGQPRALLFRAPAGGTRHPTRRLDRDRPDPELTQCRGVLPKPSRDIEDAHPRPHAERFESERGHAVEEIGAGSVHTDRHHVAHVSIEIGDPHR